MVVGKDRSSAQRNGDDRSSGMRIEPLVPTCVFGRVERQAVHWPNERSDHLEVGGTVNQAGVAGKSIREEQTRIISVGLRISEFVGVDWRKIEMSESSSIPGPQKKAIDQPK